MADGHDRPAADPHAWGRPLAFWTATTLIWLMVITVTGAAVRLTGSGLGCTDWPTCRVNDELAEPAFHSAIEFGNRVISGLAIVPLVGVWVAARRNRPDMLPWIWLSVLGFVGQVLLGMLVTRTELDPRVVLGHFLLSIVLVFFAAVLHDRARTPVTGGASGALATNGRASARHGWAMVGLMSSIIVVGTLVTGSGPHTGSDESGEAIPRLGFDIREITRVHSVLVWLFVVLLLWGLWQLRSADGAAGIAARHRLLAIGAGSAVQAGIGYTQYFTGVPVLLVGFHIAGAVVLWTMVVLHALRTSTAPVEASARSPLVGATA